MNKRLFLVFTAAAMALAVVLVSCSNPLYPAGDGSLMGEKGLEGIRPTVVEQLAEIQQYAQPGTSHTVTAFGDERIHVTQFIHYLGRAGITVTIRSESGTLRTLSMAGNGTMFKVQDYDVTLILENIILQGHDGNNHALVTVNPAATLRMNDGAVIRGNSGHGVFVNGGRLNMVGTLNLEDAPLITGNASKGVYVNSGHVNMAGFARIYRNSGGVSLNSGTLTMNDFAGINGNYNSGGVFMNGSTARLYYRSGIGGNTSRGGVFGAGGVFAKNSSHIYMFYGTRITNNTNMNTRGGGGVTLHNSTLNMFSDIEGGFAWGVHGLQILHNHTNNPFGGGVWIEHSSELNMYNGMIGGHPGSSPVFPNTTTATGIADGGFSSLYIAPGSPSSVARGVNLTLGTTPVPNGTSRNNVIQIHNGSW